MKKLITFIIAFTISISTFAQNGINYKALIKDGNGNVVASQNVDLQFIIYKGAALTNNVYQETHALVMTDANGIIIVNIGEGATDSGVYADIDWGSDDHYLNVWINTGSGLTDIATTQFMAVPYALNAANVSGLEKITEETSPGSGVFNTGWRLKGAIPANYGPIGDNAVDLSYSSIVSTAGATGNASTALGTFAAAIGDYSTAMGFSTLALGDYSNALGGDTTASGDFSTSMGFITIAQGTGATAMGSGTIATGENSTAIGAYNVEDINAYFVIGNGTDDSNRLNVFTLFPNSSFVVGSSQLDNDLTSGIDDTRLFFHKPKGAFRAGFANGDQWDDAAVGNYSTAFGFVTKANGARSTALGSGTIASGFATTAIGNYNAEVLDAYFIVGNGTGDSARKNAMVVKSNGDLIVGSSQLDDDITTAADNARVFFNKAKGAFRAGLVDDTYWDDSEVGSYSVSMGLNTKAKGQNSFAMGGNSTATGKDAVAMGGYANASGLNATSIGNQTWAEGQTSVALGGGTHAVGKWSTAMNILTTAGALASTAMGQYNIGGGAFDQWVWTDPLFEIGNSEDSENKSNALTVLKNGTITAPSFELAQITDPKALVTKEYVDTNILATGLEQITEETSPGSGVFNTGWRLKGVDSANYGNIGDNALDLSLNPSINNGTEGATGANSTAIGVDTVASNLYSTAMGLGTEASGALSTAMGSGTVASGTASTAMGNGTIASGTSSIATGDFTNASGDNSTAMGQATVASGDNSTAMGWDTAASGFESTAMGFGTIAFGNRSTAMGSFNFASGNNSTAMGNSTIASGSNSTAMGDHTVASGSVSTALGYYNIDDPNALLILGNGTSSQRNNALVVKTNGDTQFDGAVQHTSTGSANMIPIAYGSVDAFGAIIGGTGNFTVTYNAGTTSYTIFVNNTPITAANSAGVVSVNTSTFRTANTTYDGVNMLVHIFLINGNKVQSPFQFIIYQQ